MKGSGSPHCGQGELPVRIRDPQIPHFAKGSAPHLGQVPARLEISALQAGHDMSPRCAEREEPALDRDEELVAGVAISSCSSTSETSDSNLSWERPAFFGARRSLPAFLLSRAETLRAALGPESELPSSGNGKPHGQHSASAATTAPQLGQSLTSSPPFRSPHIICRIGNKLRSLGTRPGLIGESGRCWHVWRVCAF